MAPIPKVYFCAHENCSAKFRRLDKFECHERMHTGERPFICKFDGCNKSYRRPCHLKRHQQSHEGNFKCSIEGCSEVLKTKAYLQNHLKNVHSKKSKTYKCTLCDKVFNKHIWLQGHMFKHTGQLPHVCPVEDCGRSFIVPSKLKRHMKYHKGYHCKKPNCDQVFPKWSLLVKHIKESHPVVYKCETCNKAFSCYSNLRQHKLVHREDREVFSCEVANCNRFYTLKRNLVHHVKSYHNRRPFMCTREHCHRAFKTEESLAEHVMYHDSKKPRHNKKKKPKPTLAAKLAGCVPRKTINRKQTQKVDKSSEEAENLNAEQNSPDENSSDCVTVTLNMSNDLPYSDGCEYVSCLANSSEGTKSDGLEQNVPDHLTVHTSNEDSMLHATQSPSETGDRLMEDNLSNYAAVKVTMSEVLCNDDSETKSCLAIFQDILNNSFLPIEQI